MDDEEPPMNKVSISRECAEELLGIAKDWQSNLHGYIAIKGVSAKMQKRLNKCNATVAEPEQALGESENG